MGYIGWQIIMDQQAQTLRQNKLYALGQVLSSEVTRTRMVTRLLASDIPASEIYSSDQLNKIIHSRKLLLLLDVEFIYLFDPSGRIIFSESARTLLETGWQLKASSLAYQGESVAGLETLPSLEGDSDPNLAVVAAVPIKDDRDNSVQAVLVLGHKLEGQPPYLRQGSKESRETVSIFAHDRLVASSTSDGISPGAVRKTLTKDIYSNYIALGKPYYGWANVGEQRYIAAFEPLYDVEGLIVGSISVLFDRSPLLVLVRAFITRYSILAVLVFIMFLFSFYWLYTKVNRPLAALVKGAQAIALGNLAVRIPVAREVKCWEINNCNRTDCPAYENSPIRCWFDASELCNRKQGNNHTKQNSCNNCEIYRIYRGNQLDQLGDTFNFMAATIEHEQMIRQKAYEELQAQNEELNAQQEELQAQTDCLMALNKQLENTLEELDSSQDVIYTLVLALEARDQYTRGHSERVAKFAMDLGARIGLDEGAQERLRRAAILHDLGKIGVNDNILSKPARLDDEEMRLVREHPAIGEKICRPLKAASEILPIIRHHHEWYNGNGYPDGLAGENIPLGARILAVADAYDAMISDRPYRKGMSPDEVREELCRGAGIQWDATLVKAFLILLEREAAS
ncbi:MAG: HD domain-containing phosphohydrolase [Bacillota bacterium]